MIAPLAQKLSEADIMITVTHCKFRARNAALSDDQIVDLNAIA